MSVGNGQVPQTPGVASPGVPPSTPPPSSSKTAPPSVGTLLATVTTQIRQIVTDEIQLVKAKAMGALTDLGSGAVLLVAAAVFALFTLGWGLHSAEEALTLVVQPWLAALIVFGSLALITIILGLVGYVKLKQGKAVSSQVSQEFKENMTTNVGIFREGLNREQD